MIKYIIISVALAANVSLMGMANARNFLQETQNIVAKANQRGWASDNNDLYDAIDDIITNCPDDEAPEVAQLLKEEIIKKFLCNKRFSWFSNITKVGLLYNAAFLSTKAIMWIDSAYGPLLYIPVAGFMYWSQGDEIVKDVTRLQKARSICQKIEEFINKYTVHLEEVSVYIEEL